MQSLPRGTRRILAISGVILAAGSTPPRPGLAPWLSLISMAAHGRLATSPRKRSSEKLPSRVAAAEVAGADLPDEVAALAVVIRDAALAGVLQRARDLATPRLIASTAAAGQRAVAHRRGVDDRAGTERVLAAARAAQHLGAGHRVLGVVAGLGRGGAQRERGVADDQVARGLLEIVVGAEAEVVVLLLGRRVDPAALVARERPLLVVAGDDVLAQLGSPSASNQ
jgi:hypothetical protein